MSTTAAEPAVAFADFFATNYPRFLGIAQRILRSEMEAEDVLSHMYMRLSGQITTAQQNVPFVTKCTRNAALDRVRHLNAKREDEFLPEHEQYLITEDDTEDNATREHRIRRLQILDEALARLPPKQRLCALEWLGSAQPRTAAEVAEKFGISERTVFINTARARDTIREHFSHYDENGKLIVPFDVLIPTVKPRNTEESKFLRRPFFPRKRDATSTEKREELQREMLEVAVNEAVTILPPAEYRAVVLRWGKKESVESVSYILGVTRTQVYQMVNRATRRLRRYLAPFEVDGDPATDDTAFLFAYLHTQLQPTDDPSTLAHYGRKVYYAITAITPMTTKVLALLWREQLPLDTIAERLGLVRTSAPNVAKLGTRVITGILGTALRPGTLAY